MFYNKAEEAQLKKVRAYLIYNSSFGFRKNGLKAQ